MLFNKVEVSHFRNLTSATLLPSPSLNLIYGDNGSGKSSLLEAIHYLATGSSFRTHKLSTVVHQLHDCFTLYSEIGNTSKHRIGLKRCKDLNHISRVDGQDIPRRSELAQILPIQILSPESLYLLTEGSDQRRNFIDWSLFHVEQAFHFHLSQYQRALKQRNALLKQGNVYDLNHWDRQLQQHGSEVSQLRQQYVISIVPVVNELLKHLIPGIELDMSYRQGWSTEIGLDEALNNSVDTDLKLKYTTVGPHRADLSVRYKQVKVVESLSRGQLKLTVIALKLAQAILLQRQSSRSPVILIDDLAAELDVEHRSHLLDQVQQLGSQLFITTPELSLIDHSTWSEKKVFHVEHGQVKEVV